MKTSIKLAATISLIAPLLLSGVAMAIESQETEPKPTQVAHTETSTNDESEPTTDKTALPQRLEKRQGELRTKPSLVEQKRLELRCKPAQPLFKNFGDKVRANVDSRHKAYEALEQHLTTITEKLDAKGVDTTELKSQQKILDDKITVYNKDLKTYRQALTDLSTMDCAANTAGFKASLEEARKMRENLSKSIADIQTYVKETIKPTLVKIRQELAQKQETEESN